MEGLTGRRKREGGAQVKKWQTEEEGEEHRENEFAAQRAGMQGNNYSAAPSIVCPGEPNSATTNFSSSLLKPLSASWLAASEEGERRTDRQGGRLEVGQRGMWEAQEAVYKADSKISVNYFKRGFSHAQLSQRQVLWRVSLQPQKRKKQAHCSA